MNKDTIQIYLAEHDLDGWLLVDFHGYNSVFTELLAITGMLTRRAFLYIPAKGKTTAVVHAIEKSQFESIPAEIITYSSYRQFESELGKLLPDGGRIAMEYSPKGRLPYVAKVDAGTIELVRDFGVEIVSSADLVSFFQARLDEHQILSHRTAARNLLKIKDKAFALIGERLKNGQEVTEYEVSRFMLAQFEEQQMVTDHPPNCSFAANAGNPHYEPAERKSKTLRQGDIILIDLWAKLRKENSVFGDIAWMAFAGTKEDIPARYNDLFAVITKARDAAIDFLGENIGKRPVFGYEADIVCRDSIVAAGHGQNFTHRTGHSIHTSVHGNGPNIDNLETEDRRILQAGHLFSIEPGLYFEDSGFRTEIDALITEDGLEINPAPLQSEILPLG